MGISLSIIDNYEDFGQGGVIWTLFYQSFIPKYPLTQLHLRTEKYLRKKQTNITYF